MEKILRHNISESRQCELSDGTNHWPGHFFPVFKNRDVEKFFSVIFLEDKKLYFDIESSTIL